MSMEPASGTKADQQGRTLKVSMMNAYYIKESPSTYSIPTIPYWPDQMTMS